MPSQPFLSVIIPAYNEADNFKTGKLDQVNNYLKHQKYSWEVIVVDDGSTDHTVKLIKPWIKNKPGWKLIQNQHFGKSKTVSTGMLASNGTLRLFTDFDQATPISSVEKIITTYHSGYDIVIGSREAKGATRDQEPFIRHLMGRVFNALVQILALPGISDSQCGFKAFSSTAAADLFNRMIVYKNRQVADAYTGAFDVELLFLARKRGYKIAEIPVTWHYVTTSRVNAAKDSLRMLIDIIRIRMVYYSGQYQLN